MIEPWRVSWGDRGSLSLERRPPISGMIESLNLSAWGDCKSVDDIHLPIDGVLDLHTFRPEDAASVVDEYLRACSEQGLLEVRIIHGKGKGVLRRTVHALLEKHPLVIDFRLDSGPSGWGATVVQLRR